MGRKEKKINRERKQDNQNPLWEIYINSVTIIEVVQYRSIICKKILNKDIILFYEKINKDVDRTSCSQDVLKSEINNNVMIMMSKWVIAACPYAPISIVEKNPCN